MKIIQTNLPDITKENLNQSKINLADSIVHSIYPLFDEFYESKIEERNQLEESLKDKVEKVIECKNELQEIMDDMTNKKKIKKLLNRFSTLVSSGLVYDNNIKKELVVAIKIIDKLPNEKIDQYLNKTMSIISKRFARR